MSRRTAIGVLGAALFLAGLWFAGRAYVRTRAERALIVPQPLGPSTPGDVGLTYSDFTFPSGDRQLRAWLVRAPDTAGSEIAVLVFHGNRTSIAEQVGVQRALYRHGVTSMVFDYSGFGAGEGTPSVRRLREDAAAAFGVFVDSVGRAARKFVLGTSLGAAVVLDAVHEIQLGVDGVVLVGTFSSARRTAVRQGRVPPALAFLLPNLYDNVTAVRRLRKPLLVVHSEDDELFPLADAEAIVAAAGGPARLVRLAGVSHADYLADPDQWEPVIAFVRGP